MKPPKPEIPNVTIYRNKAKFTERNFTPYSLAIGQAVLTWNSLYESLGQLFWIITGGSESNWQPLGIWQSTTMDRSKRELLKAAVVRLPNKMKAEFPDLYDEIIWICKEVEKVEDIRNNVVHAPLILSIGFNTVVEIVKKTAKQEIQIQDINRNLLNNLSEIEPHSFRLNKRAERLDGKDLLAEYRWCRDVSLVLRNYSEDIFDNIKKENNSWPKRPILPKRKLSRVKIAGMNK